MDSIAEVDGYFEKVLESDDYKSATDSVRRQMENKLRKATSNLVKHHQSIYRKIKILSYGSTIRIFTSNCYLCLQIVIGITIFLKAEFVVKLKYGTMLLGLSMYEFVYNEIGQRLENEGEEIRMALYGSSWFVKPSWYRKALQIMMLRSNRLPRLGFLNIFSLNRKNKAEVMRAAYGYFNFLNEFS
ncbi:hypothetical protein LSTR_LSTR009481 [Laodelphax striatellus]|uniref:Odorant receptor n=1 Tax=Laodelphax striatellus TaxID=195883 RepID=A0A482WG35_LAOST|nr:hypothetical protein LSTR_LSTR009481 [Laodelphax striatellus]